MEILKNYQTDAELRGSFNALAGDSFGITFEPWYQMGFWTDAYQPHSIVMDGIVAANVSVNRMDMVIDGVRKRFLQLGTVMTHRGYRHRGLSRTLMEHILETYGAACDGFFLFANSTVLDFYPRFGFAQALCYQFTREVHQSGEFGLEKVDMSLRENRDRLLSVYYVNQFRSRVQVIHNAQVMMFYVPDMDVYFHCGTKTYIVADWAGECLHIYDVFSESDVTLDRVIGFFGSSVKQVTLEFVPSDTENYRAEPVLDQDTTFFATGELLDTMRREKLCIPQLFHA